MKLDPEALKAVCTGFFRYWWNKPGANTNEGYDDWAAGEGKPLVAALSCLAGEGWRPKVKRLEWEYGVGNCKGQQVWHTGNPWLFWIVKNTNSDEYVWCETLNLEGFVPASPVNGSFATLDEAKAAAQADFDRRILSAIDLPTPSVEEKLP